ncbi:MAG: DUF3757 domain-containing protein [Shewanella sp.]
MMKFISNLSIVASLLLSNASIAEEHCPTLTNIKEVASGIFISNGIDGKWIGLINGFLPTQTKVKSFEMALAIQKTLKYCTYDTSFGKLDMKFETTSGKPFSIETIGEQWHDEDGPFGITYTVCENTTPENCKFTVIPDRYDRTS